MQIYTKGVISYGVECLENAFGFYLINITKLIEICQSILFIARKHEIDYDLDFIIFIRFVNVSLFIFPTFGFYVK